MMSQWLSATTEGALLDGDASSIVSDKSSGFGRKRRWRGKRPTVAVVGDAIEAGCETRWQRPLERTIEGCALRVAPFRGRKKKSPRKGKSGWSVHLGWDRLLLMTAGGALPSSSSSSSFWLMMVVAKMVRNCSKVVARLQDLVEEVAAEIDSGIAARTPSIVALITLKGSSLLDLYRGSTLLDHYRGSTLRWFWPIG
ncbi:hypothetical protein GW17_00049519 [Ensete ventricosum]|nr:hypothetical protein GW17_00049519 [Ensete ventricosum]